MDTTTRPPRKTRGAYIGLRVSEGTKEAAERLAWSRGQTLTQFIDGLLQRELRRKPKQDRP